VVPCWANHRSRLVLITWASGKEYAEGEVVIMRPNVVHSIENPLRQINAALHVFAGNPFTTPHLPWDAVTLQEAPFDNASMMEAHPSPA
jgi:predicted metal-dependent enzyme (double-stranded beta helix superfamily)